ncbi:MAG: TSUP family transporter [Nevskiales bacterium]
MAIALGLIVGLVLGLTGAGGSIIAVPLLMWGLDWTLLQAAPVALIAVTTASSFGTVVAWDVTYIRYRAALLMALASLTTWNPAPIHTADRRCTGLPGPALVYPRIPALEWKSAERGTWQVRPGCVVYMMCKE